MSSNDVSGPPGEEPATVLGVEQELAVAVGCGGLAVVALVALPFAEGYRIGTMLVAVALFGLFGALGAFGVHSVR